MILIRGCTGNTKFSFARTGIFRN